MDFQRKNSPVELVFDQPSGGDLPPEPINADWDGQGLIVHRYTAKEAKAWQRRKISVVSISGEFPGQEPAFPRVTMNNFAAGADGAQHLLALGLSDLLFVNESTRRYSAERAEGFRAKVEEAGARYHQLDVPVSTYPMSRRPELIAKRIWTRLAALPRPCGILAKDDIAAVWVMKMLKTLGIRCPEDAPVLGVSDDMAFCHMTNPAISSVPFPARRVGFAAMALLDEMMRGEVREPTFRLQIKPRRVVARESTRRVVLSDPVVTQALDLIRENMGGDLIRVGQLCEMLGVSREGLRLKFKELLGRSPKQEIERQRLLLVREKLREPQLSLQAVAAATGFSGPDEVCRFVKARTGMTPRQLRESERI